METTTEPAPPAPPQVRVVEKHRERRPLGTAFWVALLVVPLGLSLLLGTQQGPKLEGALEADVAAALADAGLPKVRVQADGRQIAADVPTGTDSERVREVVDAVPGVLSVETTEVYASKKEARACTDLQAKLDKATKGQRILFAPGSARLTSAGAGMVGTAGRMLTACRSVSVVVGGHADDDTANGANLSLQRAKVLRAALKRTGVAPARMEIRGYGDQFATPDTSRAQNERGSVVVKEG